MARDHVEVGDPAVAAASVAVSAAVELGRELAVRPTEQRGGPAVVGVAHTAEAVHRDHDVDARRGTRAARRSARGRSDATARASADRPAARPRRTTRPTRAAAAAAISAVPCSSPPCSAQTPTREPATNRSSTPVVASSSSSIGNLGTRHAQLLTSRSLYGVSLAGPGSFGRPSTRSPRMLRCTWSVPP